MHHVQTALLGKLRERRFQAFFAAENFSRRGTLPLSKVLKVLHDRLCGKPEGQPR